VIGAEDTDQRTGAAEAGVEFVDLGIRPVLAEPIERVGAPAWAGGDTTAVVSDGDGAALVEFGEQIGHAGTRGDFRSGQQRNLRGFLRLGVDFRVVVFDADAFGGRLLGVQNRNSGNKARGVMKLVFMGFGG
jgi:hypothetical protein